MTENISMMSVAPLFVTQPDYKMSSHLTVHSQSYCQYCQIKCTYSTTLIFNFQMNDLEDKSTIKEMKMTPHEKRCGMIHILTLARHLTLSGPAL
jgi:hypothetical protein